MGLAMEPPRDIDVDPVESGFATCEEPSDERLRRPDPIASWPRRPGAPAGHGLLLSSRDWALGADATGSGGTGSLVGGWAVGCLLAVGCCAELLLGIRAGLATPHRRDRPPQRGERAIATVKGSKTSGPCGGDGGE